MKRLGNLLLGVVSLGVTLALLFGVPALLVLFAGNPFSDIWRASTGDLISQSERIRLLLLGGLTLVSWIAWVQVAYAIVTETVALSRGRMANRAPIMPGMQLAAGRLVAGTALIIGALTPSSPAPQAVASLQAIDYGVDSGTDALADGIVTASFEGEINVGAESSASASAEVPTNRDRYEVRAGDTFWSVAEATLGDGLRWSEIRDLNLGAAMADGTTITAGTEVLRAGWKLAMPADANIASPGLRTSAPAPGLQPGAQPSTVDVEQGDHLWSIAVDILTEAWGRAPSDAEVTPYWAQLVAANDANLLPPENPDLIHPGQVFDVPDVPLDPQNPNAPLSAEAPPAATPAEVPADPKQQTPRRER
ncbi:MAG: LysM peptidoglycan-binding domain-containing protein, partial [Acidimicrobiales bacterium]|nr:LysM peptidoglycan-binding domain-containing protein [Acidimicrobiales bacterium]